MSEYNIKVSKLENGTYKLKINNYSRYEVEEVEVLAIKYLQKQLQQKENIIKEVREYITSYESISIMQGIMNEYSNYDLDIKTMNEMIRRYMVVHDKLLEILDKENK